jgi:hypothetical protein
MPRPKTHPFRTIAPLSLLSTEVPGNDQRLLYKKDVSWAEAFTTGIVLLIPGYLIAWKLSVQKQGQLFVSVYHTVWTV